MAPKSTKANPLTEESDDNLLSIISENQKIVKTLDKSTDMRDYMRSEMAERKLVNALKELQKRHGCFLPGKRKFKFNATQSRDLNAAIEKYLNNPENSDISEILSIENEKLRTDAIEKISEIRTSDRALQQDLDHTYYFGPEHENISDHLFERNKTVLSSKNHDAAKVPKRIITSHVRNIVQHSPDPVESNVAVRKFQCSNCESSYTYKRDLNRHIVESHTNTEKYKCDKCHIEFKFKRNLTPHNKAKHNNATRISECK